MRLGTALAVAVLLAGCQLFSGVNDLEVTSSATGAGGNAAACDAKLFPAGPCGLYCHHMCSSCYGEQYPTDEACLVACSVFGGDLPGDNSVVCHDKQAIAGHCLAAGPSGEAVSDVQQCGTPCDNFCNLQSKVCGFKQDGAPIGVYNDYDDCTMNCMGYAQLSPFTADGPDGDTFECRFRQLLTASTLGADTVEKGNACAATGPGSIPCD